MTLELSQPGELIHVTKPVTDPKRGLWFWRHTSDAGTVQLSSHATTLTPRYCSAHDFAFDSPTCPACDGRPRQLEMFGGANG